MDVIDKNRRVDIVIRNGKHIYPIEVKIWAGDQDEQLCDYFYYYFKKMKYDGNKIYYLTPTGWNPSKKSAGTELSNDSISCISFNEDISKWLNELIDTDIDFGVKNIINQYIEVINIMCKSTIEEGAKPDMFDN